MGHPRGDRRLYAAAVITSVWQSEAAAILLAARAVVDLVVSPEAASVALLSVRSQNTVTARGRRFWARSSRTR